MKLQHWTLNAERTNSHFITFEGIQPLYLGADDEDEGPPKLIAQVRWDGCMFVEDERPTLYHICDPVTEVGRWREVAIISLAYYGGDYNIGGVNDLWTAYFLAKLELFEGPIEDFFQSVIAHANGASMN